MRVVVVGSPYTPHPREVRQALKMCREVALGKGTELTVVLGGIRSGAEQVAHQWVEERRRRQETGVAPSWPMTPRWDDPCRANCKEGHRRPNSRSPGGTSCPSAPFYRNEELAKMDVDMYLIWVHDGFRSADHMAELCKRNGLPHQVFRSQSPS